MDYDNECNIHGPFHGMVCETCFSIAKGASMLASGRTDKSATVPKKCPECGYSGIIAMREDGTLYEDSFHCEVCFLRTKITSIEEGLYKQFLSWRGIEEPCEKCGGSGSYLYPNTSTWSGGIGGQAMTTDVCDICWGTGDTYRKGADLRKVKSRLSALEKVVEAAKKYRSESVCHCPDKSHEQMLDGGLTVKNCGCYGVHLDAALREGKSK